MNGEAGNLETKQPEFGHSDNDTQYQWDLHLSNHVPMEMTVNMGAGRATMTLGGLALEQPRVRIWVRVRPRWT